MPHLTSWNASSVWRFTWAREMEIASGREDICNRESVARILAIVAKASILTRKLICICDCARMYIGSDMSSIIAAKPVWWSSAIEDGGESAGLDVHERILNFKTSWILNFNGIPEGDCRLQSRLLKTRTIGKQEGEGGGGLPWITTACW